MLPAFDMSDAAPVAIASSERITRRIRNEQSTRPIPRMSDAELLEQYREWSGQFAAVSDTVETTAVQDFDEFADVPTVVTPIVELACPADCPACEVRRSATDEALNVLRREGCL